MIVNSRQTTLNVTIMHPRCEPAVEARLRFG